MSIATSKILQAVSVQLHHASSSSCVPAPLCHMLQCPGVASPHLGSPNTPCCHSLPCRSNYAPFFSFWDDITGTRSKACCQLNPSTPLNLAAHTCYMVAVFGGMYLALTRPLQALAAYVLLYLVVPPGLVAAVFNALHVPEGVRAIMGGLMDCYRSDNAVTYAAPGQPGSWDSASKGSSQAVPVPIYIFGCHPTGNYSSRPRSTASSYKAC